MQEMYQHLTGEPFQAEKERQMERTYGHIGGHIGELGDNPVQVFGGREQPEQLQVGDRVRLKGDHEGHWLTIKRMDTYQAAAPNDPNGIFCTLSYWTRQPAGPQGAPVLSELAGFRPECLTKEPPPTAKRPSWRTVKTPKPVTRAKKR